MLLASPVRVSLPLYLSTCTGCVRARTFQLMKCSACSNPLDLPATHFLCMHSFHQRCLGDNERECPLCAPANRTILEIKRSQEANAARHDQFFRQLEAADDGFAVVADYFGRNVFNRIVLMDGGSGGAGPAAGEGAAAAAARRRP
jgi:vacuolar protein sorting-associated protein 11